MRPLSCRLGRAVLWIAPLMLLSATGCAHRRSSTPAPAPGVETEPQPRLPLPAYAHNDYMNPRPLWDALDLGFQGVEADFYVEHGELLVGHNPYELRRGRTLERLYLVPLREIVGQHGRILAGEIPFILNLEAKTKGLEAYLALHDLLGRYRDMLTVVENGVVQEGPIQVILVGRHPPLEWLAQQPTRFVSVQGRFRDLPADHERYPSHLLSLISAEYGEVFSWRGRGPVDDEFRASLQQLAAAKRAVPGRRLRVYEAPARESVYRALLAGGVDLIGVKDLERSRPLLEKAAAGEP